MGLKQRYRTYFTYKNGLLKIIDFVKNQEFEIKCLRNQHNYFEIPSGVLVPAYILAYLIDKGGTSEKGLFVHRICYILNTGQDITNKQIHHVNLNRTDNFIKNLVSLSKEDHAKLHDKWSIT